MYIVHSPI